MALCFCACCEAELEVAGVCGRGWWAQGEKEAERWGTGRGQSWESAPGTPLSPPVFDFLYRGPAPTFVFPQTVHVSVSSLLGPKPWWWCSGGLQSIQPHLLESSRSPRVSLESERITHYKKPHPLPPSAPLTLETTWPQAGTVDYY